jgi:hypothetical protein
LKVYSGSGKRRVSYRNSAACRCDPVQVLEDHEDRLRLALPEQEVLGGGLQGALPALGGIERLPGGVLDGHVEQGQQGGQGWLERPIQGEELAGHLLADLAVGLAIVDLGTP